MNLMEANAHLKLLITDLCLKELKNTSYKEQKAFSCNAIFLKDVKATHYKRCRNILGQENFIVFVKDYSFSFLIFIS